MHTCIYYIITINILHRNCFFFYFDIKHFAKNIAIFILLVLFFLIIRQSTRFVNAAATKLKLYDTYKAQTKLFKIDFCK